MATDPTYSVVIPTYNRADYCVETVRSVLAQTLTDYEVVVIDDGSQDHTDRALAPYMDRIRYIRQDNGGIAAARNRGIAESRGEFIAFLDSDDKWLPGLLEAVDRTFREFPDAGAVFMAERKMDPQGNVLPRVHTKRTPGRYFTPAGMISRDTGVGCGRPPVVRRALLDEHGGFDGELWAVDCDIWIRYAFQTPMVLMPEPLVLHRIHPGNQSADRARDSRDWLIILDKIARDQPQFVREHRRIFKRTVGKHQLRLGRELLAQCREDPTQLAEARRRLAAAVRTYPAFARAWIYLAWSYVAPRSYAAWRRFELGRTVEGHQASD